MVATREFTSTSTPSPRRLARVCRTVGIIQWDYDQVSGMRIIVALLKRIDPERLHVILKSPVALELNRFRLR